MTQPITDARQALERMLVHPNNLLDCHAALAHGPGRRWKEPSLNHAAVFLVVAAWQAYVEETANAVLSALTPPAGAATIPHFNLVKASLNTVLGRFNTPDPYNTRQLFLTLGFDPQPAWTWTVAGVAHSITEVELELNDWLKVRHKIAHGETLPTITVVTGRAAGVPTLRKIDVERCRGFFRRLADATTAAANAQFP